MGDEGVGAESGAGPERHGETMSGTAVEGVGQRRSAPKIIRTRDPEEASARAAGYFYPNRIDLAAPGFGMDMHVIDLGAMATALLRFDTETVYSILEREDAYHVNAGIDGAVDLRIGSKRLVADPSVGIIATPSTLSTVSGWRSGKERLLGVKFVRSALEGQLRALTGRDVEGQVRFDTQMRLDRGIGAQWIRLVQALATEAAEQAAEQGPTGWHPLLAARTSDAVMTGLLLASDHQFSDLLRREDRPVGPAAVERAVEIIQERAHEPLTVSSIAAEVGLSVRALQSGFRRAVGVTPGVYLTQVRLERAHRTLIDATRQSASATAVAAMWGFGNYGRFARKYRERYGESPAETLAGAPLIRATRIMGGLRRHDAARATSSSPETQATPPSTSA
ncbi:AraC family transcriptional regulator [Nocardioides sp. Iso805N]|uniref:AraC family transcriptional regulator n=1 Tax=Nocardioides sp. Iso805N TaxID=1283287 RepID=UPI000364C296|nr:AraC family transcriptional regulator [Nocardioides sp. Iso805N]